MIELSNCGTSQGCGSSGRSFAGPNDCHTAVQSGLILPRRPGRAHQSDPSPPLNVQAHVDPRPHYRPGSAPGDMRNEATRCGSPASSRAPCRCRPIQIHRQAKRVAPTVFCQPWEKVGRRYRRNTFGDVIEYLRARKYKYPVLDHVAWRAIFQRGLLWKVHQPLNLHRLTTDAIAADLILGTRFGHADWRLQPLSFSGANRLQVRS